MNTLSSETELGSMSDHSLGSSLAQNIQYRIARERLAAKLQSQETQLHTDSTSHETGSSSSTSRDASHRGIRALTSQESDNGRRETMLLQNNGVSSDTHKKPSPLDNGGAVEANGSQTLGATSDLLDTGSRSIKEKPLSRDAQRCSSTREETSLNRKSGNGVVRQESKVLRHYDNVINSFDENKIDDVNSASAKEVRTTNAQGFSYTEQARISLQSFHLKKTNIRK